MVASAAAGQRVAIFTRAVFPPGSGTVNWPGTRRFTRIAPSRNVTACRAYSVIANPASWTQHHHASSKLCTA